MCVPGVVRRISPPPPFLPMGGKAASPLKGEAERGQGKRLCFRLLSGSEGK